MVIITRKILEKYFSAIPEFTKFYIFLSKVFNNSVIPEDMAYYLHLYLYAFCNCVLHEILPI